MRPPSTVSPTVPGERRVGGPLPEIAGGSAAQIPPCAQPQHRHAGETGDRRERVDPDHCDDGEQRRHGRDQRLGQCEADRAGERVDVRRRAGDQVARPGALDGRERQAQHPIHEVLAQLREHLLGEDERGPPREPRDDRLHRDEEREEEHDAVDVRRGRARDDGLDERAEQRRACQAGAGGEGVEDEDARDATAVAPAERPRLEAQLGAVRDREKGGHGRLAHASSPLVTVSR